jgi:LPS sulfotransferase NodH
LYRVTEQPTTAYLVCATPRSGSTLLCEMLRTTGIAGNPLEHFEVLRHSGLPRQPREYFDGMGDPGVLELLAPLESGRPSDESAEAWRARVLHRGMTANGVWAGKLMWGHVEDLLSRARELHGLADADLATALHALLGEVRLVFVTRTDKVAQAVSLWRAVQTRRWRADAGAPRRPYHAEYRFSAIDHLVAQLELQEEAWRAWFARDAGGHPLELVYEQVVAEPAVAVADVLRFVGLPAELEPGEPPLRRQRDARSRAWAERYVAEKRAAAA